MRYYGEEYKKHIRDSLTKVHDSVDGNDYAARIRRVDVSSKNMGHKIECVNAARNANSNVNSVKEKLQVLITLMGDFYDNTDEISDSVLGSAKKINSILKETNNALVRMDDAINGTGKYSGTKVTTETLKAAGLNTSKCDKLKTDLAIDFVDYNRKLGLSNKPISTQEFKNMDAIFGKYISKIKALDPNKISAEDKERLEAIYTYYCNYHLGPNVDVREFSEQSLKNGIDAYELINPKAKQITDKFFKPAYAKGDSEIDLNVLRTKYALYTADPDERDVMLYYMPYMKLYILKPGEGAKTVYWDPPIICIDFKDKDDTGRCCAFFHEFGHGLDCLLDFPSDSYTDDLVLDLKKHMHDACVEMDIKLLPEQEQEVIDYFFTCENSNVVDSTGKDWPYPGSWTTGQVMAYYQLRKYYGYVEYEFNPGEYSSDDNKAFKVKYHDGYSSGKSYEEIKAEDLEPYKDKKTDEKKTDMSMGNYNAVQAAKNAKVKEEPKAKTKSWHNNYGIISDVGGGLTNYQLGGVCSAHGVNTSVDKDELPNDASRIKSVNDVYQRLKKHKYFYGKKYLFNSDIRKLNTAAAHEFFAENWEYDVLGFDKNPTTNTFPTACQDFDNTKKTMIENTKY